MPCPRCAAPAIAIAASPRPVSAGAVSETPGDLASIMLELEDAGLTTLARAEKEGHSIGRPVVAAVKVEDVAPSIEDEAIIVLTCHFGALEAECEFDAASHRQALARLVRGEACNVVGAIAAFRPKLVLSGCAIVQSR